MQKAQKCRTIRWKFRNTKGQCLFLISLYRLVIFCVVHTTKNAHIIALIFYYFLYAEHKPRLDSTLLFLALNFQVALKFQVPDWYNSYILFHSTVDAKQIISYLLPQ